MDKLLCQLPLLPSVSSSGRRKLPLEEHSHLLDESPLLTSFPNRCWSPNTNKQADQSAKGCQGAEEGMQGTVGVFPAHRNPKLPDTRGYF